MKSYICKDAVFKLIPKDVKGATKCKVLETFEGAFKIELMTDETIHTNEPVEMYSITPQGLLYFETFTKNVEGRVVELINPISHRFLQRREYTRIELQKQIILQEKDSEISIRATVLDVSAGGMKISTEKELSFKKEYKVKFELDRNIKVDCNFQPIRIENNRDSLYTVSGRFMILKNLDRIGLVQFCFRKQMENQNK